MESGTRVATANVRCTLGLADARTALGAVLAAGPDLVGLQEWSPRRWRLLRERATGADGYRWGVRAAGGCVVGARAGRYDLLHRRTRVLSLPGRAERRGGPRAGRLGVEPGRVATVAVYGDRRTGRTVALVSYHLVSGVQAAGAYRADRPRLVGRHRREVARLQGLVDDLLAAGHVVHAVGDSNYDGLRLSGVTSAWDAFPDAPGTLGPRRHVDDVHGPGPALEVEPVVTPSDHLALVVRRADPPAPA